MGEKNKGKLALENFTTCHKMKVTLKGHPTESPNPTLAQLKIGHVTG